VLVAIIAGAIRAVNEYLQRAGDPHQQSAVVPSSWDSWAMWLVVLTILKNISHGEGLSHILIYIMENNKCLKPPTSYGHGSDSLYIAITIPYQSWYDHEACGILKLLKNTKIAKQPLALQSWVNFDGQAACPHIAALLVNSPHKVMPGSWEGGENQSHVTKSWIHMEFS